MSDKPAFPLDAEQLVRLTGAVVARLINASRHPDAKPVRESDVILALADITGVHVATDRAEHGVLVGNRISRTSLAQYGRGPTGSEVRLETVPPHTPGGTDAA